MVRIVAALCLTMFILMTGCTEENKSAPTVKRDEVAEALKKVDKTIEPEITAKDLMKGADVSGISMPSLKTGKTVSLKSFAGKKILLDFWSSWCVPCIEMFPALDRIRKEYEEKGDTVKVISVNLDPIPEKAREIMKKHKVGFEVLKAPKGLINAGILMPNTLVVNKKGVIVQQVNGKHSYENLKQLLGVK